MKTAATWLTAAAIACSAAGLSSSAVASEADSILPEEFSDIRPLRLTEDAERIAEASALYIQAIFEEESEGPDKALETKRKVLALDPAFSDLAVESAHQYLRRGETTEAISVLKDAAKARPEYIEPALALSSIYLRQLEKPDLAEKYALQALTSAPDEPGGYESLWEVYRATSQRTKIDALFARAEKREFARADFSLRLADLRLRDAGINGQLTPEATEAVAVFLEKAVKSESDARTLARTGDYFVAIGRTERAATLYTMALRLKPSLEGVRDRLAACLLQTGNSSEAATLLEENVKDNPLDVQSYDLLGKIYWTSGEFPKALAHLRQSILIAPPDPRRYDAVIRLSFLTGATETARDFASEARKVFPKNAEYTVFLAIAQSELKDHATAMTTFADAAVEAAITRPDLLNADFYFSYGVASEQAGHFERASEMFLKSIELDPERSARACNYLGYMWADRNENLDQAEALIRRALELDPDNGAYLDSLGWVLYRKGFYDEALTELLRAAAALDDPDPIVLEHIGDTYDKLGKIAEAVLYWQKAVKLDPSNKTLNGKLETAASRIIPPREPPTPQTPAR